MPELNEGLLEKGQWEPAKPYDFSIMGALGRSRALSSLRSLLKPTFGRKGNSASPKLHRTAYLDGLRGFAAFLVYIGHHELWAHDVDGVNGAISGIFESGYGVNGEYHFVTFPFVRNFFTGGHYAVTIFFVISGYVLSVKPLSLIQAGEYTKLGDNLGSALFRRWLRLNIPVIVTTFVYMCSWWIFDFHAIPERANTFREELFHWWQEGTNFTFVFRTGGEPWFSYNFHTWSIPVEFKGSIAIYTTLMAVSRFTRNARLATMLFLMWYFMYVVDGWYGSLFIAGMMLADLDLLAQKDELPGIIKIFKPISKPIWYAMFVISMWFGGVPSHTLNKEDAQKAWGWYYACFLKPVALFDYKWYFLFWAATFMVACIPRLPWLKSFFETQICLYLGKVSFALYLVHGPVLWSLGDRIYAAVGYSRPIHAEKLAGWINIFPLPKSGPLGLEPAFLLPQIILMPLTFWLAEVVTKMVDDPTVKFAQWLYRKGLPNGGTVKL